MASYQELYDLLSNNDLRNKIRVAIVVKAQELIDLTTPTADQLNWASNALNNPEDKAKQIMPYVLAVNKTATSQQIIDATDTAIQSNVSDAIDKLISGSIV